jgi:hypothetical protein
VSNEELRRLLVNAVPEAPAPTDRWTAVAGLVRRRRRQRLAVSLATAVVAVIAIGTGAAQLLPAAHHGPGPTPVPPAGNSTPSLSPSPARETKLGEPVTVSPSLAPPGVAFDPARIPPGSPGSGVPRVVHDGEMPTPTGDGNGIFRTVCLYSHMNNDDPLTAPGKPGTTYLNMYWGNSRTAAGSTVASIAGSGNSTCRGGTVDRSAYWLPAVIDTKTHTPLAPELIHVFFEAGYLGVKTQQVQPLPAGLRMLAGNAGATVKQDHVRWTCWDGGPPSVDTIPHNCKPGDWVAVEVFFPQCWNGHDVDSPDHRRHMAYAIEGKGCPAGYPVVLPQIGYAALYPVTAGTDTSGWRLASDTYPAGQPGGYAVQAGFVNGWQADIVNTWVAGCIRAAMTCGSHMLGDGRVIEGDK